MRFVSLVVSTTHSLGGVIEDYFHFTVGEKQSFESVSQSYNTLQFVKAYSYSLFHLIIAIITHVRPGQHFNLIFQRVKVRLRRNQCHTAACMMDTRLECKSPNPYLFPTQLVLCYDQLEIFPFARKTRSQTKVVIAFPLTLKDVEQGIDFRFMRYKN